LIKKLPEIKNLKPSIFPSQKLRGKKTQGTGDTSLYYSQKFISYEIIAQKSPVSF
jgi:hypothetical protein